MQCPAAHDELSSLWLATGKAHATRDASGAYSSAETLTFTAATALRVHPVACR